MPQHNYAAAATLEATVRVDGGTHFNNSSEDDHYAQQLPPARYAQQVARPQEDSLSQRVVQLEHQLRAQSNSCHSSAAIDLWAAAAELNAVKQQLIETEHDAMTATRLVSLPGTLLYTRRMSAVIHLLNALLYTC